MRCPVYISIMRCSSGRNMDSRHQWGLWHWTKPYYCRTIYVSLLVLPLMPICLITLCCLSPVHTSVCMLPRCIAIAITYVCHVRLTLVPFPKHLDDVSGITRALPHEYTWYLFSNSKYTFIKKTRAHKTQLHDYGNVNILSDKIPPFKLKCIVNN